MQQQSGEYEALVIGLEIILEIGGKICSSHWRLSIGTSSIKRGV